MDDLLALMNDCVPNNDNQSLPPSPSSSCAKITSNRRHSNNTSSSTSSSATNTKHSNNTISASSSSCDSTIDPLTKIRIVNRQISKLDIIDFFAPFTFHTTTVLSSMTNQSLSTILVNSNNYSNNNNSFLSGRTNAATMGIIFSTSGSIRSKRNQAFTKITIGDLHTGPTLSILLFGNAYSAYMMKLKVGMVVALAGMSLMGSNGAGTGTGTGEGSIGRGGETRLTFSINDVDQVEIVGKALDYGICLGHTADRTRKWNSYDHGQGNNANTVNGQKVTVRCKNYVDLRISKYCQYHIRQAQGEQKQQHQSSKISSLMHMTKNQYTNRNNNLAQQTQHTLSALTTTPSTSNATTNNRTQLSFIQSMKAQRAETKLLRQQTSRIYNRCGMTMTTPLSTMSASTPVATAATKHKNSNSNNIGRRTTHTSSSLGLSSSFISNDNIISMRNRNGSIGLQEVQSSKSLMNVPKHITKGSLTTSFCNPYATKGTSSACKLKDQTPNTTNSLEKKKMTKDLHNNDDILGQALLKSSNTTTSAASTVTTTVDSKPNTKRQREPLFKSTIVSSSSRDSSSISTSSISIQRKRKYIPSNVEGFDGQVCIPKPNPLFSKNYSTTIMSSTQATTTSMTTGERKSVITPSPSQKASVIERQKQLAEQIKMNKCMVQKEKKKKKEKKNNNLDTNSSSSMSSKISSFDNFGVDILSQSDVTTTNNGFSLLLTSAEKLNILQSKSKYEMEAHAESFAKTRQYLNELEKKEYVHDQKQKSNTILRTSTSMSTSTATANSSSSSISSKIKTVWICKTCHNRKFTFRPSLCLRQNHVVKQKREMNEEELCKSSKEKRLNIRMKDVKDGGLTIGSGLEWSNGYKN